MAESIRGINVVIGAETTGLTAALSDVNKKSKDVQSELKQVDKLLKLDPTNTDLVAQKQKLLSDAVANTSDKLTRLKAAQDQVDKQFASGDITEGQYRAFQREVAATEAELANLNKALDEQGGKVSKLGKDYQESFDQAQKSMGNTFESAKKVGAGVTAVGVGLAAGLGTAVNSARDFEQEMSNVKSVMDPAEVKEFGGALNDLAIKLGADTQYSATEAAQGIEELVKAGVKTTDIINGGLAGALDLATAGDLDLASAAEIASTALNAFKDDAISVSRAADILAGAANASATDVGELKFGLAAVAAVASGVGLSFEDTANALAVFAQNGLKGSDAGTSLKTMLLNLQPHTDAAYNQFDKLGLMVVNTQQAMQYLAKLGIKPVEQTADGVINALAQYYAKMDGAKTVTAKYIKQAKDTAAANNLMQSAFYDESGSLKSVDQIAGLLQKSLAGLNDAQRQAALQTMFGTDAIRAANILYKEGAKGVDEMDEAINKIKASDVAAQKLDNLNGTIEQLNGSVETAKISIGNALLPALKSITEVIQSVVDAFNGLSPSMQSAIAISAAIAAALALIGGPLLILIGFIPQIVAGFTALGTVFGVLLGPIGLVIATVAALAAAAFLIIQYWDPIKDFFSKLWDWLSSFFMRWAEVIAILMPFLGIPLLIIKYWDDIKAGLTAVWNWIKTQAIDIFNAIKDDLMKILDGYITYFTGIWELIKNIFAGALLLIVDLVTGNFGKLKTDSIAIWNNLKDAFAKIWDGIKQILSGALGILQSLFSSSWSAIKSVADTIWQSIKDGIQTAIDWIKGLPSTMVELGKNMIQGLVDGIKSMVGKVGDAIKGITDKVTGSIRDTLGIHSPSRVLMQLGEYTGQGFANGIGNTISDVKQRASDMAAAASNVMAGMSSPGVQLAGGGGGGSTSYNFDGMFSGAVFNVRNYEDAKAIARELYSMQRTAMRGAGVK